MKAPSSTIVLDVPIALDVSTSPISNITFSINHIPRMNILLNSLSFISHLLVSRAFHTRCGHFFSPSLFVRRKISELKTASEIISWIPRIVSSPMKLMGVKMANISIARSFSRIHTMYLGMDTMLIIFIRPSESVKVLRVHFVSRGMLLQISTTACGRSPVRICLAV